MGISWTGDYPFICSILSMSFLSYLLPLTIRVPIINAITFITSFLAFTALLLAAIYSKKLYPQYYMALFLLAIGQFFNSIAEFTWFILEFLGKSPYPSVADIFYILYYPVFGVGILLIPIERRSEKLKSFFDFAIIVGSSTALIWVFNLKPVLLGGGEFINVLISTVYILGDIIILFLIVDLIINKEARFSNTMLLFILSIVTLLVTDLLFSYMEYGIYYSGSFIDLGWILSYLLLTLASYEFLSGEWKTSKDVLMDIRVADILPDLFPIAIFIIIIILLFKNEIEASAALGRSLLVIFLFLIGRHHLILNENRKLLETAEFEKRKAQSYLDVAASLIMLLDNEQRIKIINKKGLEILECSEDEIKGKNWFLNFLPADERPRREKEYLQRVEMGDDEYELTGRIITCNGKEKILYITARLLYENGDFVGSIVSGADITEVYKMEKKLQEREKWYRGIFNTAPNIILTLDRDFNIKNANNVIEDVLGYTPREVIGKNFNDILRDKLIAPKTGEYRVLRKDDTIIYSRINFSELEDEIVAIIEDITPLKKSIMEKDLLLREIHHRIKNNLQVILGLLNMEERRLKNPKVGIIFEDVKNRIKSISLLHENIYKAVDLARVNIREYVKDIVSSVSQNFKEDVEIIMDIEKIRLNIETALPVGLIVNELLTNIFKYSGATQVNIQFKNLDGVFQLTVADNGKGIESIDQLKNSGGLGWQLIESLTDQLEGEIKIKSRDGLAFTLTFKELKYKERLTGS